MVEKERVDIATGEVGRERWYPLTSLSSQRCGPKELLRVFRQHWSVENSLHHVKDRSWDEDVHALRRPGLGEVFAALVNTALNALHLEECFPPDVHAPASQDLRLPTNADHRPPLRSSLLTLQSSWGQWCPGGKGGIGGARGNAEGVGGCLAQAASRVPGAAGTVGPGRPGVEQLCGQRRNGGGRVAAPATEPALVKTRVHGHRLATMDATSLQRLYRVGHPPGRGDRRAPGRRHQPLPSRRWTG